MGPRGVAALLTMNAVSGLAALWGLVTGFEPTSIPAVVLVLVVLSTLPLMGRVPVNPDKW